MPNGHDQPDSAYSALTDHEDDARWAFGTGFTDPLQGVDTSVPDGADPASLAVYCLMLGDDALIMSHRLQQWCTRAPELEDEMALANIGLDLLGQARRLLARAAAAEGAGEDEDTLAFGREEHEFRNVQFAEPADPDFAFLITRLLTFSAWRLALLSRLTSSCDPVLAAIAELGVSEVAYHRGYAARWAVRLGDGTALSHQRMQRALDAVLPAATELFVPHEVELRAAQAGFGTDPAAVRDEVTGVLAEVLGTATLAVPAAPAGGPDPAPTGRGGVHSPAMAGILAELQCVARALPGSTW